MPDPRATDSRGEHPSEEDLDGVVLFDPTAHSPFDDPPPRGRGRRALVVLLAGVPLLAAVVYGAYVTREQWMPADEVVPLPPPPVVTDDEPRGPRLEALTRSELSGPVESSVALAVRAMSIRGPVADSVVVFEVIEGEGLLEADSARTDARGIARAELSLPPRTGIISVSAQLVASDLRTSFTVRVLPGPAARIGTLGGDGQSAMVDSLLTERLSLTVTDQAGNPVPGVEVRFSPTSGMVAPMRMRSDSTGSVFTRWRLGPSEGPQRVTATVEELDTILTFRATAEARPVVVEDRPQPVETRPVTVVPRGFVIGSSHVCALVADAVSCRGASVRGQGATSSGLVALATGGSHVCGLDPSGNAVCWGANEGGQLGDGTRSDRESPVAVRTELRFSTLTAGETHTCGLAGGGVPICWGQNLNGQIGDGSRIDRLAPTTVGGGLTFTSLVAGWNHTCGLTGNGNAFCWGLNNEGQLGDGSRLDQLTPTLVRAAVASITAGSSHTCGISGGRVLCWGDNRFGQLGDGSTEGRAQPVPVEGLPGTATQVVAGAVHTCALVADGSAHCWGQNLHGQLGNGSTQNANRATAVSGDLRFRSIHAGGALTCGFSQDGTQYCWGLNQNGQLGDGTRQSRAVPTQVR